MSTFLRKGKTFVAAAIALVACVAVFSLTAFAHSALAEENDVYAQATAAQEQVEQSAATYEQAKQALEEGLKNVAFLRTNIEIIDRFFDTDEVQEIWLTFSDPQMKNPRKRLSSTYFMERYRRFLSDGGVIHVKTDSNFLFTYTNYMVERNHLPVLFCTEDLYHTDGFDEQTLTILSIQTYYEAQWIERGLNIRYLKFRLPHEGGLEEPDIEIPLDDYRSYKRPKRSGLETSK